MDGLASRIIPSKNTTHVPIEVTILVACIAGSDIHRGGNHCGNNSKGKPSERINSSPPTDLVDLAQMAWDYNDQILKNWPKEIPHDPAKPSKAVQPIVEKLGCLPSYKVEVFENEVTTIRGEIGEAHRTSVIKQIGLNEPTTLTSLDHGGPLDYWYVGYESPSKIVYDEEIYHSLHHPIEYASSTVSRMHRAAQAACHAGHRGNPQPLGILRSDFRCASALPPCHGAVLHTL
ncbi:hypothetical protein HAX54_029523 [Datura stramonium]|uniref:Uncharacterized protein n=1 Tax=Datura stramonium TaxID=4076 RepID=A0ABS8V643_DATST|nr:hypothetical protein [Datura stramonium]